MQEIIIFRKKREAGFNRGIIRTVIDVFETEVEGRYEVWTLGDIPTGEFESEIGAEILAAGHPKAWYRWSNFWGDYDIPNESGGKVFRGTLGVHPRTHYNGIEFHFRIQPLEVTQLSRDPERTMPLLRFDLTRQVESIYLTREPGKDWVVMAERIFPTGDESINDDPDGIFGQFDESDEDPSPEDGMVFQFDTPGFLIDLELYRSYAEDPVSVQRPLGKGYRQELKGKDFVRVKIVDDAVTEHQDFFGSVNGVTVPPDGSRCSDKVCWKSRVESEIAEDFHVIPEIKWPKRVGDNFIYRTDENFNQILDK